MIQKPIKLRQDQAHPFEVDEMDANLKELDNRTKHDDPQLNTIQLLAEKVVQILLNIPDVSEFETSSQLNSRDTENRKRENHTGTQLAETISDFQAAVLQYAPAGLELGETADKAYRGDRGKTAYDHSQVAHAPATANQNEVLGRVATGAGPVSGLTKAQLRALIGFDDFTTQEINSGGNYNDLEVTADVLVFTNENAQAILNGVWGRKEFHILNLSSQYEILINHDSSSVSGNGQPIMLPTNSGTAGIKGTARILQTDSYGYFVADTWGSKYRPEFSELTEDKVMLVGADHRAKAEDIIELKFYRTNQATAMDSAELENEYPNSIQGTEVICTPINKKYEKIDNLGNWVEIDFVTI